ncbi:C-GCAxxG-C-C family (seleno)protein [Planctomycetota bacterium]
MPLAGGIAQQGLQCGMLWGATLAAGARAHRLHGSGPRAEAAAITAAQSLVESFRARNNGINCLEITDTDWTKTTQMIYEFECSEIVGRKFKDIGDHSRYLNAGGCSEIIEELVLAATTVASRRSKRRGS